MRTIVRGGRVLDVERGDAPFRDVLVEDGRITEIGPPGLAAPADAATIEAVGRMLVPGLINGHSHSHGALGRGLVGDRWTLEVFLAASPGVLGNRTLEDKRLSALLGAAEMVRRGCTAVFDLFGEFPAATVEGVHAVASAYAEIGMRAVVAPMIADKSLYEALPGLADAFPEPLKRRVEAIRLAPVETTLAACRDAMRNWPCTDGRVRFGLGPTIPLHCSDAFMIGCADLSREFDLPLQTHLAETKVQAGIGRDRYGMSLTAHLQRLGALGPRVSTAHAIWIDDDDIARLADSGCTAVHNPMSNLRLGSGLAPTRRMLDRDLAVAIGTDGSNTSDGQNMIEATRLAAFLSRIGAHDPAHWIDAGEALRMATIGGARALGLEGKIGRIAPGFAADIVFIDLTAVHYQPLRNPLLQLAYAENAAGVDSVMIGGTMVLDRGRFVTIDYDKLRADAAEAASRLDDLVAVDPATQDVMQAAMLRFCGRQYERDLGMSRIADLRRF